MRTFFFDFLEPGMTKVSLLSWFQNASYGTHFALFIPRNNGIKKRKSRVEIHIQTLLMSYQYIKIDP
jgi:hypothetical protein